MTDVHSKKVRSYNMSMIKSRDTKPELIIRKFLFSNGFRYRLNIANLPGKPDIVLPKYKTIIFVHGCFWHGHKNCKYSIIPKTRTDWWTTKIENNRIRDKKIKSILMKHGWKVITIWECQLKSLKRDYTLNKLIKSLNERK
jgi:DNA mismatch endonuclease (patch repair protein)